MNLQQILKLEQFEGWIKLIPERLQNRAENLHELWLEISMRMAKERHKELVEVKRSVREWAGSPEMAEFGKKARLRYLKQQLKLACVEQERNKERYDDAVYEGYGAQDCVRRAEGLVKRIGGYRRAIGMAEGRITDKYAITEEMVERAREFPIENLLEVGVNRRVKCPFHDGTDYNADIRKNFLFCYRCNESGDVISIYRKLNDCSFAEAIIALQ